MGKEKKRFITRNMKAAFVVILAGASLFTYNKLKQEPVSVIRTQYEQLEAEKPFTVMIYMNGSTLEEDCGAATADIREMLSAVSGPDGEAIHNNVNIVVEAGGAQEWELENMQESRYARFSLGNQEIKHFEPLAVRNMGEPETLADFINYAVLSYPAQRYGIIFWDHGGGAIGGFGYDCNFDGDGLSVNEIGKAVTLSRMQNQPFEFAAFDACLMGSLEMAACLKNQAHYMIASEELEPQNGYSYEWLSYFSEVPADGLAIGRRIADSYIESYGQKNFQLEMSVVDLSQYDAFHQALHAYLISAHFNYDELSRKRRNITGFGSMFDEESENVDLLSLIETMDSSGLKGVKQCLADFVVYQRSSGFDDGLGGLTVYLPQGFDENLAGHLKDYYSMEFCTEYRALVQNYGEYLMQGNKTTSSRIETEREGENISIQLNEEEVRQLAYAYLAVFCESEHKGIYYLLSTDSDVSFEDGMLKADIDTNYIGLKDTLFCLMEKNNRKQFVEYVSPILYNGLACTMKIRFDSNYENGVIVSVIPFQSEGVAVKQMYMPQQGDTLTPLYPAEAVEGADFDDIALRTDVGGSRFLKGPEIVIESEVDFTLHEIETDEKSLSYCFLLVDTFQNMEYTNIIY